MAPIAGVKMSAPLQGSRARGLEDGTVLTLNEYAASLDIRVLKDLDGLDVDGTYELSIGQEVEFGYHDDYAE